MPAFPQIEIYSDGGCRNNPDLGAWAFVVIADEVDVANFSGTKESTTSNGWS